MDRTLLYLSESDVRASLDMKGAIKAVEEGLHALGQGKAVQPEKIYMDIEKYHGFVKPMTAYVKPMEIIASKIFTFFPENPRKYNLPTVSAIIVLTNPKDGATIAIMDGTYITALRTAATTAIAAKYLAKKNSQIVGIIGAGVQGRSHLMALNEIFNLKEVRIADKFNDAKENFTKEMQERFNFPIIPSESYEKTIKGADIVITATTGDEPLVKKGQFEEGMFLAKVGSYQEIDFEIVQSTADKIVVDWWEYVSHRVKEIAKLLEAGVITRERIYSELADIVVGEKRGRESSKEKILFISIGMGVEDASAALVAYNNALKQGIGQRLRV